MNSMQSTHSLVKIHNSCSFLKTVISFSQPYQATFDKCFNFPLVRSNNLETSEQHGSLFKIRKSIRVPKSHRMRKKAEIFKLKHEWKVTTHQGGRWKLQFLVRQSNLNPSYSESRLGSHGNIGSLGNNEHCI